MTKKSRSFVAVFALMLMWSTVYFVPLGHAERLKVGFILPLTGFLAEYGVSTQRMIEIALTQDEPLRDKLQLYFEDSAYNPSTAVAAYKKLLEVNHVKLVYSFGAPMLEAIAPLAERDKIPFFATESDGRIATKYTYTTLFMNEIREFGYVLTRELERRGIKKLGVVKTENHFINTWVRGIKENLPVGMSAIEIFSADPGASDFRGLIPRIERAQFDALGLFFLIDSHRPFLQQYGAKMKQHFIFGTDNLQFRDHNSGFFDLIEGALLSELILPDGLKEDYEGRYGESHAIYYTVQGYRFIKFLSALLKNAELLAGEGVIRELSRCSENSSGCSVLSGLGEAVVVKGATAQIGRYISFPIGIYEIRGGKNDLIRRELIPSQYFR